MTTRSRRSLAAINNGNKPYIGRRTGKVIEINARLDDDGYERVSDYFPDTDSDSDVSIPELPNHDDENINKSKLTKSNHNSSRRALRKEQNKSRSEHTPKKSSNRSKISPDSAVGSTDSEISNLKIDDGKHIFQQKNPAISTAKKLHKQHVSSPEKHVSSPEKQVFSPEKPVSTTKKQVSTTKKQVSSPKKPVSSNKTQVSSPDKPASPSDRQVLSPVKSINRVMPASINCSKVMVDSSPVTDINPGSTRKTLRFSFANTSSVEEDERLDIEQSLLTAKQSNDPIEEDYVITDSPKRRDTKKTTTKKSSKKTTPLPKSLESDEDDDEVLTREVCKSNQDTFLTLGKKPNNTIRDMLYKSTSSKTIVIQDTPENLQPLSGQKTTTNEHQEPPGNKTTATQKATQSKIPVRKYRRKKGPKLTFRSTRKLPPKTADETISQKARYRKTPGAKNAVRKTRNAVAGDKRPDETDKDEGDDDIRINTTVTLKAADGSASNKPSAIPSLRKKVARSKKELTEEEAKAEPESGAQAPKAEVKKRKDQASTKKTSKIPLSTRAVNRRKTAPNDGEGKQRSQEADKTTEKKQTQDNELKVTKSDTRNATGLRKNTRTPAGDQHKASPNTSRESLEAETDSEFGGSVPPVDPLPRSTSSQKITFSPLSDDGLEAAEDGGETTRIARKRKLDDEISKAENSVQKPSQNRSKRGTATKVRKANKSQGKAKAVEAKTTKNIDENSEKSSGFSSDEEARNFSNLPTVSGSDVNPGTESSPECTVFESEDGESNVKAPRNRKKRAGKLDSVGAAINPEENESIGLRRSQRNRVPCLQFWRNEHIEYERRKSGYVVKEVVIPSPIVTHRKRRAENKPVKQTSKKAMRDTNSDEEESDFCASTQSDIPDEMDYKTDPVATVIDPRTMNEVDMKVLHNAKSLDLRSPTSSLPDATLLVDKYFSQRKFGAGEILLRPGAEKGRQHVRRDTMIFHVLTGRVLFSIHNQSFMVSKGSGFFVPQGNLYNLQNLDKKRDARLFFCQIKE